MLVLGATGTVGQIAVQAAKLLGAAKVVGACRTGGDGIVGLDEIGDAFGERRLHRRASIRSGASRSPRARACRAACTHRALGQSAGAVAPLRSADVRSKELLIQGHSNFAMSKDDRIAPTSSCSITSTPAASRSSLERVPARPVADAWERQRAGGKVVVTL